MKKAILGSILLSTTISLSGQASFPTCFSETKSINTIAVQSCPNTIAVADFNADGRKDMAIGHSNSNVISILLGDASGNFVQGNDVLPFTIGSVYMGLYKPHIIETGDFNNDGKADLVTFDYNNYTLMIILGNGNGTFTYHASYTTGGNRSSGVTLNDFNNDGNLDFAVSNYITNNASVFIGNGTGSFSTPQLFPAGTGPQAIASTDINHDGKIDIFIGNYSSGNISVLLGTGTGSFVASGTYTTGQGAHSITFGDFNNDTHPDLAIANQYVNTLSVLFGNGGGMFLSAVNYTVGLSPRTVRAKDINEDGFPDLALTAETANQVEILLGSASGNFTKTYEFGLGSHPKAIIVEDLDGDNKMDIAATNFAASTISILKGSGTGTFSAPLSFQQGSRPFMFSIEDFNNDGRNDLAFSSITANFVSVILSAGNGDYNSTTNYNVGTSQTDIVSADYNGDGNIDIIAAGQILLGTVSGTFAAAIPVNASGIISADFNNDGNADIASRSSIYLGTGNAAFSSAINYPSSNYFTDVVCYDFNNDGKPDIAGYSQTTHSILFLAGNGSGGFNISGNYNVGTAEHERIAAGDFNKDGIADIASSSRNANEISVLIGQGQGNFASVVNYQVGALLSGLAVSDYNGDDNLDIAVSEDNYVILLLGSPTGTFSTGSTYDIGLDPVAIKSGDLNEDGRADLIVSNGSIYKFSVLLNGSPSISVSTSSLCLGNSLLLNAGNNNSYTWNTGATTNSIIVNPVVTTTYSASASIIIAGCNNVASKSFNVIVGPLPTINVVTGSGSVCVGSSYEIVVTGVNSYTWNNGAVTSSISVTPTISSIYTVTGSNSCGLTTETISIIVDNTCQDVWPGDANSDGTADNLDVLELGLHYTQTGPARAATSNNWQSYFSNNWTGNITNGKNLNHSDCNGDGTINDNDTLAIFSNYGLTHAFKGNQQTVTNPQLSIVPDQAAVVKGTWGTSSIYLGDAITSINNINGLAFIVNFDNTLIETNSVWIEYPNSFLNASNQNLHFRKLDFGNSNLYTATTHTINNNVSGNGLIAVLHYQVKSALLTDEVLNLGIVQANHSNASGTIIPLTSGTATLMAIGASVGLNETTTGNMVTVSPNPVGSTVLISSTTELEKIELLNLTGQVLISELTSEKTQRLNVETLANGVYFVKVYNSSKQVALEKLIIQK